MGREVTLPQPSPDEHAETRLAWRHDGLNGRKGPPARGAGQVGARSDLIARVPMKRWGRR
jgi:hypothetical protein